MAEHPTRQKELLELFNEKAPIARAFGMTLSFAEGGRAVIDLPYNPDLDHARGGIHGGIYATMLDNAGWFTAAATRKSAGWVATSELSIHFLEPLKRSALRAIGRIIKAGKRQVVAEMELLDEKENLVGHATGTFILLPEIPLTGADRRSRP